MQTSDLTSFASPLDDFFQKYIPREHEKTLRNSFIQAIALVTCGGIFFGLYYVYSILEPFCIPLMWALLTGIVLHPYKRTITKCFQNYLDNVIKNDQTIVVSLGLTLVEVVDNIAVSIGTYVTTRWKVIVSTSLLLPLLHGITYFFPGAISALLKLLQQVVFVDIILSLNCVQLHHVFITIILFLITLFLDREEYKLVCQISSMVAWFIFGAYLSNFLWAPLVYLFSCLWIYGYCTEPTSCDEPDASPSRSQDTRIKSAFFSFLGHFGLLGNDETDSPPGKLFPDDRRSSDPSPATSTPIIKQPVKEVTPEEDTIDTEPEGHKLAKALSLETAAKVLTMTDTPKLMHPGVSKLQKEYGVVRSKERLGNISVIGRSPIGGNTPKSRVLGRSYVFRLKRRSSLHRLGTDSWTYIRWAFWSCVLLQLWVRPATGHLLPAPIAYYIIKQVSNFTGFTQFLLSKTKSLHRLVWKWIEDRYDIIFPPPLLFLLNISYSVERKIIQGTKDYIDVIVTVLMITCMVLGLIVATIFISFQVYTESVYVVQSLASITASLNVSDSYIFMKINHSFAGSGYESMENVVDGAYNYSRDWISQTLRQSLADADGNARRDLELKVLKLWDKSYQYWVTNKRASSGGRLGDEAISSNLGELLTQVYSSATVFNVSAVQTFVQNNMGTLTSIVEQVWSLFKGNIGFLFDTCLGIIKIILNSGSGVVNFVFGIFIYLTASFYLLSNSTDTYIPMEVISQYSIFQISGVGGTIQKAVNSVFLITIKMSVFYLLWTYITHVVFDASIVVLPMLFSSFIAACPFTGQYIVALPAALELYCLQHRSLAALLLVISQVAPSWLVDTAIYSEVRGGIHPWFTGLAVVGGVYVFGVLGAIYGPLALCVLYVIINVYSTFITDTELDTPEVRAHTQPGHRSTLIRSGTVG